MREPLLGFLAAAALLFTLYESTQGASEKEIHVSSEIIELLRDEQQLLRGYELDDPELERIIQRYIDEEVMVREAYARGLDRSDGRIRQRLIGKIDFLIEEEPEDPTAEDLKAFYEAAPENYFYPVTLDTRQILGPSGSLSAENLPALEQDSITPEDLGSVRLFYGTREEELADTLGAEAAKALFSSPIGSWHGPFDTKGGDLLVQVVALNEAAWFSDEKLERFIREDWYIQQRKKLRRAKLDALRKNYQIVIERSEAQESVPSA